MNILSRNTPVAFVVGAAGFLGSHLVDELLSKGIQVVGVDDFSSGTKDNLEEAVKNKHFHLFSQDGADSLPFEFPRLDYAFFMISTDISSRSYHRALNNFLSICKENKGKIVLVSSVQLYDREKLGLKDLKDAEKDLASFAMDHKLNARIVRLAEIYGPRMHFKTSEGLLRLIKSTVLGKLQQDSTPLDFTTRSLYVADAVKLLIKVVMHSATAQKIYDGALSHPIKISEVKQVLLDPLWHESRKFTPTELPPWPTPNLEKTCKELAWEPNTSVVTGLKETLAYFKDKPSILEKIKDEVESFSRPFVLHQEEKHAELPDESEKSEKSEDAKRVKKWNISKLKGQMMVIIGGGVVFLALVLPIARITFNFFDIKSHLSQGVKLIQTGEFNGAVNEVKLAQASSEDIGNTINSLEILGKLGIFNPFFNKATSLTQILDQTTDGALDTTLGARDLALASQAISGGNVLAEDVTIKQTLENSTQGFRNADKKLDFLQVQLQNTIGLPGFLQTEVNNLQEKAVFWQKEVKMGESAAFLLSQTVGSGEEKNYLVLLLDNNSLQPGGGYINSFATVKFKGGKLENIKADNIDNLDNQLKDKVTPPAELQKDLNITTWSLKTANFEADLPTNSKMLQWFYQKESGNQAAGIVTFDLIAMQKLLEIFGPVDIPQTQIKISSENLMEQSTTPTGKKLLGYVLQEVLNRVFYLEKRDWLLSVDSFDQLASQKHLQAYLPDPTLFSFLSTRGLAKAMPRQLPEAKGERGEFLALSETNLENNSLNLYLNRSILLESKVLNTGVISHKLTINYLNQNPTQSIVGGKYKAKVKVYLSSGSKLEKVLWGSQDITKSTSSFSDYGRAGYSAYIDVKPGEQKALVLQYQDGKNLDLSKDGVKVTFNIIKQPGTGSDEFKLKFNYPNVLRVIDAGEGQIGEGEVNFSTKLDSDKAWEINLVKSSPM